MLLIWSIAKANEIDNQEPMPIIPHDCRIDRTENELWMFSEMNFRGGMDSDSEHHPHTIRIFSRTVHIQSICCWVWWLQTQYWRTIYHRVINKSKMWWGHRFFLTFSLLIVNDQQFFFSLSIASSVIRWQQKLIATETERNLMIVFIEFLLRKKYDSKSILWICLV